MHIGRGAVNRHDQMHINRCYNYTKKYIVDYISGLYLNKLLYHVITGMTQMIITTVYSSVSQIKLYEEIPSSAGA